MELKVISVEELEKICSGTNSVKVSLGTDAGHSMYLTITDVTSYTDEDCIGMREGARQRHNERLPTHAPKIGRKQPMHRGVLDKLVGKLLPKIAGSTANGLMTSPGTYTYDVTPSGDGAMYADFKMGAPKEGYDAAGAAGLSIQLAFAEGLVPMNPDPNAPPDAPKTYGSVADRSFTVILDTTPAIYSKEERDENEACDDIYAEGGHKVLSPNGSIRKTASNITKEELEGLFFEPPSVYR